MLKEEKINKTVFVTGAGKGLGAKICSELVDCGYNVYGASRNSIDLELVGEGQYKAGKIDVTDGESCISAIQDCLKHFGNIDVLINNASGSLGRKSIGEYKPSEIFQEVSTALGGAICVSNAFVISLSNARAEFTKDIQRKILFISSSSGVLDEPGNASFSIYAAAKAGIIRFSDCLNDDLKDKFISTFALVPHNIRTDNFVEQQAISVNDVLKVIHFILSENDNLMIKGNAFKDIERTKPPSSFYFYVVLFWCNIESHLFLRRLYDDKTKYFIHNTE